MLAENATIQCPTPKSCTCPSDCPNRNSENKAGQNIGRTEYCPYDYFSPIYWSYKDEKQFLKMMPNSIYYGLLLIYVNEQKLTFGWYLYFSWINIRFRGGNMPFSSITFIWEWYLQNIIIFTTWVETYRYVFRHRNIFWMYLIYIYRKKLLQSGNTGKVQHVSCLHTNLTLHKYISLTFVSLQTMSIHSYFWDLP